MLRVQVPLSPEEFMLRVRVFLSRYRLPSCSPAHLRGVPAVTTLSLSLPHGNHLSCYDLLSTLDPRDTCSVLESRDAMSVSSPQTSLAYLDVALAAS